MFEGKRIGIVVPAHNEERLIARTITTMPEFVDHIVVVNDGSGDRTLEIVQGLASGDHRIDVVDHETNLGLGQTLIDGYQRALELDAEVIAVMAGDAQMDPGDLPDVLRPITSGTADYAKGNRLLVDDVRRQMPGYRFYGNAVLTILTKFATGYYHVIDPQCGYTAISARALRAIHIDEMTKGYGYNADILTRLNILNFRVADVAVRPVYGEAVSGIKLRRYVPRVSWLLSKLFFKRLKEKYLIRDFHPVVLFYLAAMVLTPLAVFLGGWIVEHYLVNHRVSVPTVTLFAIFALFAGQAACFAMWIDMDYNKHLNAQFGRPIGSRAPSGGAEPAAGEE